MDKTQGKVKKSGLSRRAFIKSAGIAGLTAGTVGTAGVVKKTPAFAGVDTNSPIVKFAVREVKEPPYKKVPFADSDKLKRYDERLQAFQNKELAKQNFGGKPWFMSMEKNVIKTIKANTPGYKLIDHTFANVSWTSYRGSNFFSWEPLGVANLRRLEMVGRWEASPEENNQIIKKVGYIWGAGDIGVAPLNENWFYANDTKGIPIIFSDKHDRPTVTEEAKYVPKNMKRVIVMLAPMEGALTSYAPSALGGASVGTGYSLMAEMASKMAEFIRGLGYNAIPMGNDTGLSVPMAIDAGLGELGRHGILVNPILGSNLRIAKVATDMPIATDKPIEFGVAEFCRTCMKCAEKCPSESISFDKAPSYEVTCNSNNPGMKKWYFNSWSCLTFWTENGAGCANCQIVCPYSKPSTWIHDVVKGVSSKTSIFNSTFAKLDDALGYGNIEENEPAKWWSKEGRPRKWISS